MPSTFIFTYRIGDITLCIEMASAARPLEQLPAEWFRVADGEADLCCRWRAVDAAQLPLPPLGAGEIAAVRHLVSGPSSGWECPVWRSPLVRDWLQAALTTSDTIRLLMRGSSVTALDFARREVEYFTVEAGESVVAGPGLTEIGPFLPSFSAAAVHSLSLVRGGIAGLFLAPDGGGKTTIALNLRTGTVLSDDQVVLRLKDGSWMAYSTPWGRAHTGQASAPLGAFFLLEQAECFELTPVEPATVLEYLWQGLVHYDLLPRRLKVEAFDLLRQLSRQALAYRMRFARDYVDWDAIDAALVG